MSEEKREGRGIGGNHIFTTHKRRLMFYLMNVGAGKEGWRWMGCGTLQLRDEPGEKAGQGILVGVQVGWCADGGLVS